MKAPCCAREGAILVEVIGGHIAIEYIVNTIIISCCHERTNDKSNAVIECVMIANLRQRTLQPVQGGKNLLFVLTACHR